MPNLLPGRSAEAQFWKEVREKDCYARFRAEVFEMWEKFGDSVPIPALKYSDYRKYRVTGNRSDYQGTYYLPRLSLSCAALLALMYPEEEKYLVRAQDAVWAICDEYSWCLPAHQPDPEKNDNCFIDLFAAETGLTLAEVYYLLGERLEPLVRARIVAEIDRRVVDSYISRVFHWEKLTHNWNAVCSGAVGCTLMLMRPDVFDTQRERIARAMETYLSGLSEDGICFEGVGYWNYGFGFFVVYAEMLRRYTGEDWFRLEKVRKTASFQQKMFLSANACVSFSDSGATLNYHPGLLHFLRSEYPDEICVFDPAYSRGWDGCARFAFQLRGAAWLEEETYFHFTPDTEAHEYHAPEAQWFIKRTFTYGFAAKGGCNAEPHNHNDIGSFIFAKNGRQQLCDFGSGAYTRQYFESASRYLMPECASRGHSVPIIGGEGQKQGGAFRAGDVRYGEGTFSLDLAPAYGIEGLHSLVRSFRCLPDRVLLTDTFDADVGLSPVSRLVSSFRPIPGVDTVTVGQTVIAFSPAQVTLSITSEQASKGRTFWYMDFALRDGQKEIELEIR